MRNSNFTRSLTLALALLSGALEAADYQNPVLPGDYPDPTVIRVGDEYWATATTSEWAPLFPLLRSKDLVNWEHVSNVFTRRPNWAVGNFWAPELFTHEGKFYLYYTGRRRGGPLSIAVATADRPEGPWTDHGPIIGQALGSIDAFPVVDTDGARYLIWKEDGNSRNQPTPLWIEKLSDDGLKLVGEMKELFRNDADWERNLVEGAAMLRRGDYWYLFYAGNACCGRGCNYAEGVARAKNLLGPWEKNPANPILIGNAQWKCPGHGTLVRDGEGRDWFLYHAYHAQTFIYVGRQGLLDEITWNDDQWPTINDGDGPSFSAPAPSSATAKPASRQFADAFSQSKLRPEWQWPQNNEPRTEIQNGKLLLGAGGSRADDFVAGVLALKTTSGFYTAEVELDLTSVKGNAGAGLSAYGDVANALGVTIRDGKALLWRRQRNRHETISTNSVPETSVLRLRLTAERGHRFAFQMSGDGTNWQKVGGNIDVEGDYLPPWDRGVRVALVVGGREAAATFDNVQVAPNAQP